MAEDVAGGAAAPPSAPAGQHPHEEQGGAGAAAASSVGTIGDQDLLLLLSGVEGGQTARPTVIDVGSVRAI